MHQGLQGVEALGVGIDIAAVDQPFPQQDMQDAMQQGHVGARQDGQVQIGQLAGVSASRVDHDDLHLGTPGLGFFQAAEQHRVGIGHIAADDQQAVALLDVLVVAGRGVGAQAALVADHRRAHAQARVAVDIVGAHQRPRQLVKGVVVLGQQLAADIEGHAVRAVFADGFGEYIGGVVQGTVPVRTGAGQALAQAQLGVQAAGVEVAGQVQAGALAAEFAEVGRVIRIALYAEDLLVVMFDQHAAADTAVAAGGRGDLSGAGHHSGSYRRRVDNAVLVHQSVVLQVENASRFSTLRLYAHFSAVFRASCTRPFSTRA